MPGISQSIVNDTVICVVSRDAQGFAEFRAAARNKFQFIFGGNRVFTNNSYREAECATEGSARSEARPLVNGKYICR